MAQHKKKYLDPEKLKQIGSLEIVARQVVEGLRIGSHKSPARGISSEFSAYRQYVAGDETRHIDWKAYARFNRYYIKQFDAETNFVANLLLDGSKSMTYGSNPNGLTKLEYAKFMAASLAYLTINQGDSAGVGMFDGELSNYVNPKSSLSVLNDISDQMEQLEPRPRTNVGGILHDFAHRMTKRGFVMLFSDLFDNTEEFMNGLSHLRYGGHNVILFHILDPDESSIEISHHLLKVTDRKPPSMSFREIPEEFYKNELFYFRSLQCRRFIGNPLADALHLPYHPSPWKRAKLIVKSTIFLTAVRIYTLAAKWIPGMRLLMTRYHAWGFSKFHEHWLQTHKSKLAKALHRNEKPSCITKKQKSSETRLDAPTDSLCPFAMIASPN